MSPEPPPESQRREAHLPQPDIEEDRSLGEEEVGLPEWRMNLTHEKTKLLYSPLPPDLPTMRKDLLIQMAAYEGNIDRYARLIRRRSMNRSEVTCVIRGIVHHTMFARCWADQLETNIQHSGLL